MQTIYIYLHNKKCIIKKAGKYFIIMEYYYVLLILMKSKSLAWQYVLKIRWHNLIIL